MRLWNGIEREGRQNGENTLFIESDCVLTDDLTIISREANKRNIKRLYFGANRIDLLYITKEWIEILKGYTVVIETSVENFRKIKEKENFSAIILRYDIEMEKYDNIIPKIDNGKNVTLYYERVKTELSTLKDGLFTDTDELINI